MRDLRTQVGLWIGHAGDGVQLAGRVGVADNIQIGAMARIGAQLRCHERCARGRNVAQFSGDARQEAARNYTCSSGGSRRCLKKWLDGV